MNLWVLFFSAFGAATILPFYSEITLAVLLSRGEDNLLLWSVATAGNSLGATVNWGLGRYLSHFEHKSWFPFKEKKMAKSRVWFQRYGVWTLLFAWLPIVGDLLTFIAGSLRVRFAWFLLLTTIGKGARYAVVIFLFRAISS